MPWQKNNPPDALKNLDTPIRNKAIDIANALLRDGMEEGRAISIAIEKSREYLGGDARQEVYQVKKHEEGWQLKKGSGDRAVLVEGTKQNLLEKAKPYVNKHQAVLKIYHEDGSLQETLYEHD